MNTPSKNHIGRKISRIRELKDMKQEALAAALGTNQQAISMMENSENIDEDKLKEVAKALGVTPDAIKNFSEEAVINIINNTFSDFKDNSSAINYNCSLNFNPLDKLIETYEENKKLYERLLESEKNRKI
ncbi:transcriptional regulator [Flavobacterium noncentrifugens]|uniref:Helix-turn-helix n=1 Tax=Flavobacterium noncentrifugens TaxID=1128970 RepID=A0A1G9CSX6_9FLAO|nr:helix-turn-helix transcriptional regulator [Flavobacterium noncentrifugens]GEP52140.1 transcriptional regulator [Flavobacterium noncentrifugens]SDK54729.1 Helix-turn-helix [Flavobacterium noncentrifugens]